MSTQPAKTSSVKFTIFKWVCIIVALVSISLPTTRIFVHLFGEIDEKLYARVFMSYRVNSADAFMINGRYKKISPKAYPTSEDRNKFNKIAQEGDNAVLTGYKYPEHFSLEPEWAYTLCDDVYYLLWNIRVKVCEYPKKNEQEAADGLVVSPSSSKDERFFRQVPKMTDEEYKELFTGVDDKNGKGWASAADKFIVIVLTLIDKPEDYKMKYGKISSKFENDIKAFVKQLGYSDEEMKKIEPEIPNFFIQFGKAFPTVYHSTIYSRLYYFFIFLTINGKFDYSEIEKANGMKAEEYNKQAMKIMATVFAQIFSKVYEEGYDYEMKDGGFSNWIVKKFGPSQDISKVKDQSKNINIVKDVLTKNREILNK